MERNQLNVGFIGCGVIGRRRADALRGLANFIGCFDVSADKSNTFAFDFSCRSFTNVEELIESSEIDFVVIATQHDSLAKLATESLKEFKHVFLEKPGACNSKDLRKVIKLATKNSLKLRIGFNHNFHPAILKMFELIENGDIGSLMYSRVRYGHGGRVGYESEWRAKKKVAGGGELIDQGSHIIDLILKLFGDIKVSYAATPTYFWNMEVEDNAFMVMEDSNGRIGFLHASCTEWKNLFSMEVYGTKGKIEVTGLGRSYGTETLNLYQMSPEMGPPETFSFQFDGPDLSWKLELEQFMRDIEQKTYQSDNSESSIRVLQIVEEIYRRTGR